MTVLVVQDDRADGKLAEIALRQTQQKPEVVFAQNIGAALEQVALGAPDVILLDLELPDTVGVDGVLQLARHASMVPIVVLSADGDEETALSALESGAQDYLVKGDYSRRLLARSMRYAMERKRSENELIRTARYDAVTGLINRPYFFGLLEHALERAQRTATSVDVLFLDLDHFKYVNDSLGHAAGDSLLKQLGARIQGCVRTSDVVARLGGDEFTVILEGVESAGVVAVAEKILIGVRQPFDIGGTEVIVSPSIGIAGYPGSAADAQALVQHADTAMYRAKSRGRNTVEFFSDEMNAEVRAAFEMEMALRGALARNEFELRYQPIVDRPTGSTRTVEALIRWRRTAGAEVVGPAEFLPTLERTGLIREVGTWVLRAACTQCRAWQESLHPSLRVAVNVSPVQLGAHGFADLVQNVLRDTGLRASDLQIEITEEVLLEKTDANKATLERLTEMGVGIAIDDFGSGYSSLSYLTAFPFDTVKIDRGFVARVAGHDDDAAIAAGILSIAANLGRSTVAEGVETEAQLEFLSTHACDLVQGYLFSRPLTVADFETFQRSRAHLGAPT